MLHIDRVNINDLFKITAENAKDESAFAQLKDQYNKAKQDIIDRRANDKLCVFYLLQA